MNKRFSLLEPEKDEQDVQQEKLYAGGNVRFASNYSTPLQGHMYTRTYGVAVDMYDGQKDKTSKIQFEAEVTIRQFPDQGYFEYKIKKDKFFINKRAPKTLVEKLSIKTLEVLYPLEIQTTLKNELLSIINHEAILERWQKIKPQLQKEYTGEAMRQYIAKFEASIHKKHKLLQSLRQEVFYTLLFQDIYTSYNASLEKEVTIAFPVLGFKKPLIFNGIQKINKKKTYYNTVNSCFTTKINNDPIAAQLDVEYDLNGNAFLLENIISKCSITHNDTIIKTVKASLYYLKEKPNLHKTYEDMRDDIIKRQRAIRKEENKDLTIKQRIVKWFNT